MSHDLEALDAMSNPLSYLPSGRLCTQTMCVEFRTFAPRHDYTIVAEDEAARIRATTYTHPESDVDVVVVDIHERPGWDGWEEDDFPIKSSNLPSSDLDEWQIALGFERLRAPTNGTNPYAKAFGLTDRNAAIPSMTGYQGRRYIETTINPKGANRLLNLLPGSADIEVVGHPGLYTTTDFERRMNAGQYIMATTFPMNLHDRDHFPGLAEVAGKLLRSWRAAGFQVDFRTWDAITECGLAISGIAQGQTIPSLLIMDLDELERMIDDIARELFPRDRNAANSLKDDIRTDIAERHDRLLGMDGPELPRGLESLFVAGTALPESLAL